MARLCVKDLTVFCAIALSGACARYEPLRLTTAAVEEKLAAPDAKKLSVAAGELKHPILPAMKIEAGKPLSPDEVAVIAVIANPALRAERDQRAIAAAQLVQAGLLPNPVVNVGADFPYAGPDDFTAYSIGVDWEITSLIARDQRRRAAAATAASVDLDIAWKEWQTAQEARTIAYSVIALRTSLAAGKQFEAQSAENLTIVRKAVESHDKTLVELAAAQSAAEDAHTAVADVERELTHQELLLSRVLGLRPDAKLELRDDVQLPAANAPSVESMLNGLEDRRLDLLALKRGYESQDATLRASILAQFPKISLGPNIARDTSNVRSIGIGLAIDLPIFDRNQAVIATEKATRQKLFDEYVDRVAAARSEVAQAAADIRALNSSIAAGEAALAARKQLADVYQKSFTRGDVDAINYYGVATSVWQKQLDVIKLKQSLVEAWMSLQLASGQFMPLKTQPPAKEPS